MRSVLIKLGILLTLFGVFTLSHIYYKNKAEKLHEQVVVQQYEMLDNKLFTLEAQEKNRALAQNASYEELQVLQLQEKSASSRRDIGFWVSVVLGVLFSGYFIYVLAYCYVYRELIKNEGYKKIVAWLKKMNGTDPDKPKDE